MVEEKTVVCNIASHLPTAQPKPLSPCVIVVAGRSNVGRMFKLGSAETRIGRTPDSTIRFDDETVSRRHAKLVLEENGKAILIDLNSTNGTFANGQRISRIELKNGDKIQVGAATILKFLFQDTLDEALQRSLYESATRDGLTRVYNKKFFLDTLGKEFAYCLRHKVVLSLIMFDIDHFKQINDLFGHLAGDHVLARLAERVGETIRTEDLFARYGGEEFVLLLREVSEENALVLAERLRTLIESTTFTFNEQHIAVTLSAGISTLRNSEYTDTDSFIADADKRLYLAKSLGRNRVVASARPRNTMRIEKTVAQ